MFEKLFKRDWQYRGIGKTHSFWLGPIDVHVWQCRLTDKVRTKRI